MGKNGKDGPNRHRGKPGPSSLSAVRAVLAVDALTPAFVRWFEEVSPGSALAALECPVDLFLETAVPGWDPAQPRERLVSSMRASVLLAAASADPPETARVMAAPDVAPPAERAMADLLTGVAMTRLEELAELGLLTIDAHIRVPPALIRCIANVFDDDWVLADLGLGEVPDDGAGREPLQAAPGAAAPALSAVREAPRAAGGPVLQLKVMLNNSKPPVWRRVLVPAGMPLPQLLQVIQALFGWFEPPLTNRR